MGGTWHPSERKIAGLLFRGAPDLLDLINKIVRRPWNFQADDPLPLMQLLLEPHMLSRNSPLDGIQDRLEQSKGIPHARVDGSPRQAAQDKATAAQQGTTVVRDEVAAVQRILYAAAAGLAGQFKRVHRIRFPHFSLAVWLVGLRAADLGDTSPDERGRVIAEHLRRFVRHGHGPTESRGAGIPELLTDLPWWIRILAAQAPRITLALTRLNFRAPRWFARHPVGHGRGRRFDSLAWAFAERDPALVNPEAACSLLVDAFLQDLREAYRRNTLLGFGRRRTGYPVRLIHGAVTDSPGLRVMELIGKIRNTPVRRGGRMARRYRWDPLLVVATGDLPPDAARTIRTVAGVLHGPADSAFAYLEWRDEIEQAGRERNWFLSLRVPSADPPPAGTRAELIKVPIRSARRTRVGPALLALLLILTTLVAIDRYGHCWTWPGAPLLERQDLNGRSVQCVGLSDGRYRFFKDLSGVDGLDAEVRTALAEVEDDIVQRSNRLKDEPNVVAVVFLGALTPRESEGYRSVLTELRGVAIAQEESMRDLPIRVLLANAGDSMRYGGLAAEAIARAAAEGERIVSVIGMGQSHEGTRQAIRRLTEAAIPMVGTAISATELATTTSQYYYQVGPTNQREARMVAHYATRIAKAQRVLVYYSADPGDIYSKDLWLQTERVLAARGIEVTGKSYREGNSPEGTDLSILAQQACGLGRDGLLFYAGRAERFDELLSGLRNSCQPLPALLAGDDVTRYVLGGDLWKQPGIVFDYITFASSLAWGDCDQAIHNLAFFTQYVRKFGRSSACEDILNDSPMLAHDALLVFATAVRRARADGPTVPSPDRVLGQMGSISERRQGAVRGASGLIDFGDRDGNRVPLNKAILILHVDGGQSTPTRRLLCGHIKVTPSPDVGCPDDATDN